MEGCIYMTEKQLILIGLIATSFAVSLAFTDLLPAAVIGLFILVAGLWITVLIASRYRANQTLNLQGKVIQCLVKIHQQQTTAAMTANMGTWIDSLVPNQGFFIWGASEPENPPVQWGGWEEAVRQALSEGRIICFPEDDTPCPLPGQMKAMMVVPLAVESSSLVLFIMSESKQLINRVNRSVVEQVRSHAVLALANIARMQNQSARQASFLNIALRVLECRDPSLVGHSQRVAGISGLIGSRLGLSDLESEVVYYGALMHDIGKAVVIEDNQALDHATLGAAFLPEDGFYAEVKAAVLSHHERYDGSGYPSGLSYNDIPLPARIIAVADLYDALTCLAPKPDRMNAAAAIAVLKKSIGSSLDPWVFAAFEEIGGELKETDEQTDTDNSPV